MRFSNTGKIVFVGLFLFLAVAVAGNVTTYAAITVFTATPASGAAPLTVTFQIQGTGKDCGVQFNFASFYLLEFGDGTMYSTAASSQDPPLQTITHTYDTIGTYTATFKTGCWDNSGIVDFSKTKTIRVEQPCSTAPTPQIVSPAPNLRVPTGEAVSLNASALNPIGCIGLNYAWSLVSSPPGSTASIASPSSRITNFTPDLHGTYRLRLQTTNESSLTNQTTVTITAFTEVDLSITGSATSVPTAIGETYALDLNVRSNKQLNNDGVNITIEAPASLTLSVSPIRCSRSTSSDRQTLACLGTMSGMTLPLSVEAEVTEAGIFDINATVSLASSDLLEETNTSNNSAGFQFDVALPAINGDLSVEIGAESGSGLGLGDSVNFVVTASWAGPDSGAGEEGRNLQAQLLIDLSGVELARTPFSTSGPIECETTETANVMGPNLFTNSSISCTFTPGIGGSSSASVSVDGVANYAGGAGISANISATGPSDIVPRIEDPDADNDSDSVHLPVVGALESDLAIASMTPENHLNGAGRFDGNMDIVIVIPAVSFDEPDDERMDGHTINTYQLTLSANVRFSTHLFSHDGPGSCSTTSDGAFVCELPYSESEQRLTFQFRGEGSYSPPTETALVITAVVANLDEDAFDPNTDNNSSMIEVPLV